MKFFFVLLIRIELNLLLLYILRWNNSLFVDRLGDECHWNDVWMMLVRGMCWCIYLWKPQCLYSAAVIATDWLIPSGGVAVERPRS